MNTYFPLDESGSTEFKGGRGGLKKIGDVQPPCLHPEHNPPSMIVLQPGIYEHTCPCCGHVTRFTVNGITC